ncbi:MAG: CinA family protein [Bacilli bacterium]|nr:CinA family protein [Bacilli bacterium]
MYEIVNKLIQLNKSISTMESCTGGYIANAITNVPGASDIFMFGAVTYSNEYKVKMGVSSSLIDKYSVYSMEVANDMSKTISNYTNSDYGIGVTGKLNRVDKNNNSGENNVVFISIYDRINNKFYTDIVTVLYDERCKNKEMVLESIKKILEEIL